jgi:hypothetical protein
MDLKTEARCPVESRRQPGGSVATLAGDRLFENAMLMEDVMTKKRQEHD